MRPLPHAAGLLRKSLSRCALVLALALCVVAPAGAQTLHMVSVGISRFKDNYAGTLGSPHKDAIGMSKMFQAQKGKLFNKVSVTQLLNEQATAANIIKACQGLRPKAAADSYTLLFVASHGGTSNGQFSFCAHDQFVNWSSIQSVLGGLPGKVIVILDTCGSGGVTAAGNLIVFSACLSDQAAGENSAHGYFTNAFLKGLSGEADVNHDGKITLAELDAFVSDQLELFNKDRQPGDFQQCTLLRPADVPSSLLFSTVSITPSIIKNLDDTSWAGQETLSGFGALSFVFEAGGKLSMHDAADKDYTGTWKQDGVKITLELPDISTTYKGVLIGRTISGKGADSNGNWTFQIGRVKNLGNTTWAGEETLAGYGKLSFAFNPNGTVAMHDAADKDYVGSWTQKGSKVSLELPDIGTTYAGTLNGAALGGDGADSSGAAWKFNLKRIKSLANSTWEGSEALAGFGALRFTFQEGGKLLMHDAADKDYTGTWTQTGGKVKLELPDIGTTYTGDVTATTLAGQGVDGSNGPWNFNVVRNLTNTSWEGQETLPGFGSLNFTFESDSKATMFDGQGAMYNGTWKQEGTKITIDMPDISTTYTGTLNGAALVGLGKNDNGGQWDFNMSRSD